MHRQMATMNVPGSPPLLRRLNSALVLETIRDAGPVSRADIAKSTGLSKPTVKEVVELLVRAGYVSESVPDGNGRPRRPGPRARLLRFRGEVGHVLGIDIGANKILVDVADLAGELLASERRSTAGRALSATARLAEVRAAAAAALAAGGIERRRLRAVGVGTPGVVDPSSGKVTLAPQLDGWEGLRLSAALARSFHCPVLVDNEVHLAVVAERWRGAAREIEDAVYVHIGVGIGAGVLIGGRLHRGAGGAAGEIGYLPVADVPSANGGLGPFELAAGGFAFAERGSQAAAGRGGELLRSLAGGHPESVDAEVVFAAASRGDAVSQEIVNEVVGLLGRGIASVAVVLDPDAVIVGGGVSRAGSALLAPLEQRVSELVPRRPRFVLSSLGEEAVAIGAVRLAIQSVEERLFSFDAVAAP
jgi:predicted NBD/HSP70 family sugar kinase